MGEAKVMFSTIIGDLKRCIVLFLVSKFEKTATRLSVLDQVVRQSDNDVVTVIGAGVTLHEALAAAEILATEGVLISPSSGQMHTFKILKRYHLL